jgi:hypothetical protein
MCASDFVRRRISVTRDVLLAAAIALGLAGAVAPAGATNAQDAKKICLERYNLEKSGGTLPDGMAKSKYMSQCTNSIKRIAALESAQSRPTTNRGAGDQGRK